MTDKNQQNNQPMSDAMDELPEPHPDRVHIHIGFAFEQARKGFIFQATNTEYPSENIIEADGIDKDGTSLFFVHLLNERPESAERILNLWKQNLLQLFGCRRVGLSPGTDCPIPSALRPS